MSAKSYIALMEAIPDPARRARAQAVRKMTFEQTPKGLAEVKRAMARVLHPDVSKCAVAAEALALFNAKLDNFASIVAKGYFLDVGTNTWKPARRAG